MSRRDELAAVISGHREDGSAWFVACRCGWQGASHRQHQADAVLAWLREQLGDEELREATARALCISVNPGGYGWRENRGDWLRDAAAALDVVREWFGVTE